MWPFNPSIRPVEDGEATAWHHLRIRPTRLGLGLLVMVLLLWSVGLNYQANLAYVAAFWLLGFLVAAVLMNVKQLLGLRLMRQMPSEIFVGAKAMMRLYVQGKVRRRWLWVKTDAHETWQPWRISDGHVNIDLALQPRLRGYLRVPVIEIATAAPFGVCTVAVLWQGQSEQTVYPAALAHEVPHSFYADETREKRGMFTQSSDDLSHLQAYQDGSSPQHIAWKVYAKTGQLLDKRFETIEQARSSHVISYRDYPQGTHTDTLASWLCWRVLEAERTGLAYELELPTHRITPQHGQRELSLTALALW